MPKLIECVGERERCGLVTCDEHRNDLVTQLLIGHALARLILRLYQHGQQVIARFFLSTRLDDVVNQIINGLFCALKGVNMVSLHWPWNKAPKRVFLSIEVLKQGVNGFLERFLLAGDGDIEERAHDDIQRDAHHLFKHVVGVQVAIGLAVALGGLDHLRGVVGDVFAFKRGRGEFALSLPVITVAGQEAISGDL